MQVRGNGSPGLSGICDDARDGCGPAGRPYCVAVYQWDGDLARNYMSLRGGRHMRRTAWDAVQVSPTKQPSAVIGRLLRRLGLGTLCELFDWRLLATTCLVHDTIS